MTNSVLFLGGTGVISSACVAEAVAQGLEVTVLNRGSSSVRALPAGVETLRADLRDHASVHEVLKGRSFDAVAEFMGFTADHVRADIELFTGRTKQYVFISSASAYQTPPSRLPVTESTPLRNPFWQYSRDKIAAEDVLVTAYRESGFPATIIRPSHTYDRTVLPTLGGWTDIARMRAGRPVVVHGDGTSLWTLTHARDFAVGFVGLLCNPYAIGDSFHITGDHAPTWDQIYGWLGDAAGVSPELVHVASDVIAAADAGLGAGLLGDKAHSMVFDNAKVKALVPAFRTTVPFWEGAAQMIAYHDAHPELQKIDPSIDALFERLIAR